MDGIRELKEVLEQGLGWHGARSDVLARLLCALFQVKTVNLAQLATALSGRASLEAHYQRLQRFCRGVELDYATLARLRVSRLPAEAAPWVRTRDRTPWQFGRVDIHLLVRGIVWRGVSWPGLWTVLEQRGNSNTAERIAGLQRCVAIVGSERIAHLLADRECVGRDGLAYLQQRGIGFRIRLKQDTLIAHAPGRPAPAWRRFCDLAPQTPRVLGVRAIGGRPLAGAGLKVAPGDDVIVAGPDSPEQGLADSRVRRSTETLLAGLKSRGLQLEDTPLSDPARLSKRLAVLALAFAWAHRTGVWRCPQQPLRLKKPSAGRRRASFVTASTPSGA